MNEIPKKKEGNNSDVEIEKGDRPSTSVSQNSSKSDNSKELEIFQNDNTIALNFQNNSRPSSVNSNQRSRSASVTSTSVRSRPESAENGSHGTILDIENDANIMTVSGYKNYAIIIVSNTVICM